MGGRLSFNRRYICTQYTEDVMGGLTDFEKALLKALDIPEKGITKVALTFDGIGASLMLSRYLTKVEAKWIHCIKENIDVSPD
jgi:hypothetical protein